MSDLNKKIEIQKEVISITEESLVFQKRSIIKIRNEFSEIVLLQCKIKDKILEWNLCMDESTLNELSSLDERILNIEEELKIAINVENSFENILIKQKKILVQLCNQLAGQDKLLGLKFW